MKMFRVYVRGNALGKTVEEGRLGEFSGIVRVDPVLNCESCGEEKELVVSGDIARCGLCRGSYEEKQRMFK